MNGRNRRLSRTTQGREPFAGIAVQVAFVRAGIEKSVQIYVAEEKLRRRLLQDNTCARHAETSNAGLKAYQGYPSDAAHVCGSKGGYLAVICADTMRRQRWAACGERIPWGERQRGQSRTPEEIWQNLAAFAAVRGWQRLLCGGLTHKKVRTCRAARPCVYYNQEASIRKNTR